MDVATFASRRRSVATEAGEIAYTEFGEGPVAVFVHGLGTNGVLWRHVIEQLRDTSRCIAIDLPVHGGTPARADLSVPALAEVIADLCAALGVGQVDLVANDTGGAVAQIFAARYRGSLRTLTLTNCDTEDNLPPAEFIPLVKAAAQGELAEVFAALANDPAAWRSSPLGEGYEHPDRIPDEVWRCYFTPATLDRARDFERMLAGGAKLFFPDERPEDLVPHLRRLWAR